MLPVETNNDNIQKQNKNANMQVKLKVDIINVNIIYGSITLGLTAENCREDGMVMFNSVLWASSAS